MATETKIQEWVHKLEEGGWAKWVKLTLLVTAVIYVVILWFYRDNGFKGLFEAKAMEQAQISREVARGNGFTTKMIRPAALWQFQENKKEIKSIESFPDAYHAPLPIYVNAVAFKVFDWINDRFASLSQSGMSGFGELVYEKEMTTKSVIYAYDKIMAFMQVVFFLLAVVVNYFIAKRLFDERLALFGVGLMLVCDLFWQYSMSGLPQMLMLFLFSGAIYCLVRAVTAQVRLTTPVEAEVVSESGEVEGTTVVEVPVVDAGEVGKVGRWERPLPWLAGCAFLFGLLALTHGLTIWVFVGALLFVALFFRPIPRTVAVMLGIFLLVYSPWMIRNYRVSGTPVGLGWYSGLFQIRGTEGAVMRSMDPPLQGVSPTVFRNKITAQVIGQWESLPHHLGRIVVAPVFFVALMHLFRRRETGVLRWAVLLMWLAAVFGMSVFGLEEPGVDPNNLHVLFIPLLTFYGLAFILVMWSRLEINIRLIRVAFVTLIFLLSSLSFLTTFINLHRNPQGRVQWPPYVPPYISILAQWTTPREMIASDMPWAVAWYADRTSLWIPMSIQSFIELNDYNVLEKPIVGLYLTPVSGNASFIRDIAKGEYKEWAPFITRNANIRNFPLRAVTALPIDQECVFYADRDRWTARED